MNIFKRSFWFFFLAGFLCSAPIGRASTEPGGAEPVADHNWPAGSVEVANQPARASWKEGPLIGGGEPIRPPEGGETTFQYSGDAAALNEVLAKFAKIDSPQRLLVIHPRTNREDYVIRYGLADNTMPLNWTFTVWNPARFYALFGHSARMFLTEYPEFHQPLSPPTIEAWADSPGLDWSKVRVPAGITVTDERAASHGYKAEDGSVITGVVYDMLTSKPVQHVEVVVARSTDTQVGPPYIQIAKATGDATGRFELKKIPPGVSAISLRAPGYAGRCIGQSWFDPGTFKSFITRLSPAVAQKGTIVDTDGKPLANVRIYANEVVAMDDTAYQLARPANNSEVTTDALGHFTLTGLPMGQVQFSLNGVPYFLVDPLRIVAVPSDGLTLTMIRPGAIRIIVRNATEMAISGTLTISDQRPDKVGTWGTSFGVEKAGPYLMEAIPPAKYVVSFDPTRREDKPASVIVEVKPNQTVEAPLTVAAN